MKQSFRTKLRQLWFPAEFRLPEPEFSKEQLDLLEELIQLINPTLSQAENAMRDDKLHMANFLVNLGTGIWRIRRKIEGLSRMPKEIRDALYSLESMWLSMSEGGVEIVDHVGTLPSKQEAKVVETRKIDGLAREQVVDAVKPTILLRGEVIQLGEVIIGRPASSDGPEAEELEEAPPQEVETLTITPPLKARDSEGETAPLAEEAQDFVPLEMASEGAPHIFAAEDEETELTRLVAETRRSEMSQVPPETPERQTPSSDGGEESSPTASDAESEETAADAVAAIVEESAEETAPEGEPTALIEPAQTDGAAEPLPDKPKKSPSPRRRTRTSRIQAALDEAASVLEQNMTEPEAAAALAPAEPGPAVQDAAPAKKRTGGRRRKPQENAEIPDTPKKPRTRRAKSAPQDGE